MPLPMFSPDQDPGPDFAALLRSFEPQGQLSPMMGDIGEVTHGTTCVALRFADGVVMAGDRRATSGNWISHRSIEKVFPADHYSGVAIAGAAGPAIEMVRLFQLQLEHYEKVEGSVISLEGKANQLSQMVKAHLPNAMAGLAVVPLFAGFDLHRSEGRIWQYDVTGGRYEERDYAATGSGSMHASTVIKIQRTEEMSQVDAVSLVVRALWQAADEDSATGGPDLIRGIFPVVATITGEGFQRLEDAQIREITQTVITDLEGAQP